MPVPAVTRPVVEAVTLPLLSVPKGPFRWRETTRLLVVAMPLTDRFPKKVDVAKTPVVVEPTLIDSKKEVEDAKREFEEPRSQIGVVVEFEFAP